MNESIQFLALLFLTHVVGDFYFQPSSWVKDRNDKHLKSFKLYLHALIHAVLVFAIIYSYGGSFCLALYGALFILVTHYIVDLIKSFLPATSLYFFIDQLLHLFLILLMWAYITGNFTVTIEYLRLKLDYKLIVIFVAYLIVLKPASIIIKMLLEQWSDIVRDESIDTDSPPGNDSTGSQEERRSIVSAGKVIGMVERTLMLTFVLLNQFSGIGFLLAAKSVFRFGDLKESNDHKMTEYVMLGTLISVTFTIIIGLGALLVIKGDLVVK